MEGPGKRQHGVHGGDDTRSRRKSGDLRDPTGFCEMFRRFLSQSLCRLGPYILGGYE